MVLEKGLSWSPDVAGPPLLNERYTSLLSAPRLRNDLHCVEWDVKLYYTILLLGHPEGLAENICGRWSRNDGGLLIGVQLAQREEQFEMTSTELGSRLRDVCKVLSQFL